MHIRKSYTSFAMASAFLAEILNSRLRKADKPIHLQQSVCPDPKRLLASEAEASSYSSARYPMRRSFPSERSKMKTNRFPFELRARTSTG